MDSEIQEKSVLPGMVDSTGIQEQMDRYLETAKAEMWDLCSQSERLAIITFHSREELETELQKHNTRDDACIVVAGQGYNLSTFKHPGVDRAGRRPPLHKFYGKILTEEEWKKLSPLTHGLHLLTPYRCNVRFEPLETEKDKPADHAD